MSAGFRSTAPAPCPACARVRRRVEVSSPAGPPWCARVGHEKAPCPRPTSTREISGKPGDKKQEREVNLGREARRWLTHRVPTRRARAYARDNAARRLLGEQLTPMLDPSDWLSKASQVGFCNVTRATDGAGRCTDGSQGLWSLEEEESSSPQIAAEACLRRCSSCENCNFISVSTKWRVCSWHWRCSSPIRDDAISYEFLCGRARKVLSGNDTAHSGPKGGGTPSASIVTASREVAKLRFGPEPCPKGANLPPEVEVMSWSRNEGLGMNFQAALSALNQAACCAGRATLPRVNHLDYEPSDDGHLTLSALLGLRPRMCFGFGHLPRAARSKADCSAMRGDARMFTDLVRACPSSQYYLQPAYYALHAYLNLSLLAPRPSLFDPSQTLVAHVRSGDVFSTEAWKVSSDAYQPPLAYYLNAWRSSGLPKLHVVAEDDNSPVVRTLSLMARYTAPGNITLQQGGKDGLRADIGALVSARYLVIGRSMLHGMLLSSPELREVYSPRPLVNAWTGSCEAKVLVPSYQTPVLGPKQWEAVPMQRLQLVTRMYNETIKFKPQHSPKVMCVGL